jgi:hypothetical protein
MSLSQSTTARHGLEFLQSVIGGGYLRDRGTGMSDLVVTSRPLLVNVLKQSETIRGRQASTRRRGFVAVATDQATYGTGEIPVSSATSRRLCIPKPFENEADIRRRCGATSAWQGLLGPRIDFFV